MVCALGPLWHLTKCILVDCFLFSVLLLLLCHLICIVCPLPLQKHGKRTKHTQVPVNKSLPLMTKKMEMIQMMKTKTLSSTMMMMKKKRKTAMRTSCTTQQCQAAKAPVELARSLWQQDEHLHARPRTMMKWKALCHPSSNLTFLEGSSVMTLSRATQLVPLSASLQKYVEIQIIVPFAQMLQMFIQFLYLQMMEIKYRFGSTRNPRQLSTILWSSWAFALTNMPLKPKEKTLTPRSPGTQRLWRSANIRQEQEKHVSCL